MEVEVQVFRSFEFRKTTLHIIVKKVYMFQFKKGALIALLSLAICLQLNAQKPEKLTSGEIYRAIEKLNFLGSALYIAAHPDDENTRLISHLNNEVLAQTAYLSLTRGDGGQNRIGAEIRELLGLIRTQELLAARRTDGSSQFFSRANDFGYSKHPDETLKLWNKESVLADVIWVIRNFKPDIIVNRFNHRTPGRTHGHHTSSAMLSVEAFDLAGDESIYPEQLKYTQVWQPRRAFFNTSWWFYGSRDNFEKADKTNLVGVDVGGYLPHLGKSNTEIAAESRSMHKSQGFGATGTRGTEVEYLELVKGDLPEDKQNIFDGVNTTWSRVEGAGHIEKLIAKILESYDFVYPYNSVAQLLEIRKEIEKITDEHWKKIKLNELDRILLASTATFIEFVAEDEFANPGGQVKLHVEAINRSPLNFELVGIFSDDLSIAEKLSIPLTENENKRLDLESTLSENKSSSNPYWLNETGTIGMYAVKDQKLIGSPENKSAVSFNVTLNIEGHQLSFQRDLLYKYNDPVKGEVYKPFYIVPKVSVSIEQDVYLLTDQQSKNVIVKVKSFTDDVSGSLSLCFGKGWTSKPEKQDVQLSKKSQEAFYSFELSGPQGQDVNAISPIFKDMEDNSYTAEIIEINHDHIPSQIVIKNAEAKSVKINIKKDGNKVAYIEGAGDKVAESLRQIGYQVDVYHPSELTSSTLEGYDACIVGIRAFNIHRELKLKNDILFNFANRGGTVVVQYQTNRGLKGTDISPLQLELSRDRVTDEFASVSFENEGHMVLNYPNKLSEEDFDNWVQERGLYFPKEWDPSYQAVLGMNDKGEELKTGSLLVAPYGNGFYIYTGISFFRQLPAGVPGAYRLLANLLSIKQYN